MRFLIEVTCDVSTTVAGLGFVGCPKFGIFDFRHQRQQFVIRGIHCHQSIHVVFVEAIGLVTANDEHRGTGNGTDTLTFQFVFKEHSSGDDQVVLCRIGGSNDFQLFTLFGSQFNNSRGRGGGGWCSYDLSFKWMVEEKISAVISMKVYICQLMIETGKK